MIFKSPYPDPEIPAEPLTDFVLRHAERLADKPALIDGPTGRTYTYAQLALAIRLTAAGLAARGFAKGQVFGIYSPNVPEYAIVFHAVARLGGMVTTANPLYTSRELGQQLADCKARFLVTVPAFLENAQAAAAQAGVEEVFVFGEAPGATPFSALLESEGEPPAVAIDPAKDLVVLPYSSGTTGIPKGVMLTHRNLVANICQVAGSGTVRAPVEKDILIAVLPFYHIYGMVVIMNHGLAAGGTVVTLPRFDLDQFLGLIQKYRVTLAHLVPPIVLALAKHPAVDNYDLRTLEAVLSGAAPLGAAVQEEAAQRVGCTIFQGYGLTETSPVTHVFPLNPVRAKSASIGPGVAGTESRIVDPATGESLGPNQEGELWVRGAQVMQGYLGRPDATRASITEDGWFRTGDIAFADPDGYFYIVDRLKELIKYKGQQVAPAELEALLLSHPAISDAAVIPSPDEDAGEIPKAFVVLKGESDAQTLMDWVASQVAPHKRIRALEIVEQIPKSPSGKILRRLLVEQERPALAGEAD